MLDSRACASFKLDNALGIHLNIPGRHNVLNALAAAAVGKELGLSPEQIKAGLESAEPMGLRMQFQEFGKVKLLNDAYNANPNSMREALNTLEQIQHAGRRVAVLGEMLELGEESPGLHARAARDAAGRGLGLVLFVGRYAGLMLEEYIRAGGDRRSAFTAADSSEAWKVLQPALLPGDLVLLKASRGVHLETIPREMEKERA